MTTSSTHQPLAEAVAAGSSEEPVVAEAGAIYRVKCYLETGHTFVGWLDRYGDHYAGYTGSEDTPAGLRFTWYTWEMAWYLWDVDSLRGSARYLGPNKVGDHNSAELNLWAWAAAIVYDRNGDKRFRLSNNPNRYCYAAGSGYVYWGDYGEALQFEFVPAG